MYVVDYLVNDISCKHVKALDNITETDLFQKHMLSCRIWVEE